MDFKGMHCMTRAGLSFLLITCFLLPATVQSQNACKVYLFFAEDCPISIYMARPLRAIEKTFRGQVSFYAVFPVKNSTPESAQTFLEDHGLAGFVPVPDQDQALSLELGATVTPEAVIIDDSGQIRYRGRITDAFYAPGKRKHTKESNDLEEVLKLLVNGQEVPQPWPDAVGCFISFRPVYAND